MIERLARLRVSGLADQFDKLGMIPPVLARELVPIAGGSKFAGVAFCVKGRKLEGAGWKALTVPRDPLYDAVASHAEPGAVLLFDTGGYTDTAVFGAGTGLGLQQRGCAGAIIDGAVRDIDELESLGLPTRGRCVSAIRFGGRFAVTQIDCPIEMSGLAGSIRVEPSDPVLADSDGIIVLPASLAEKVIGMSEEADRVNELIRQDVLRGIPQGEAARRHGKTT